MISLKNLGKITFQSSPTDKGPRILPALKHQELQGIVSRPFQDNKVTDVFGGTNVMSDWRHNEKRDCL